MVDAGDEERFDEAKFKGGGINYLQHVAGTMHALERLIETLLILSPKQLAEVIINDNILRAVSLLVIAMQRVRQDQGS